MSKTMSPVVTDQVLSSKMGGHQTLTSPHLWRKIVKRFPPGKSCHSFDSPHDLTTYRKSVTISSQKNSFFSFLSSFCVSSPHGLAGDGRLKTATCQVGLIFLSCTGPPWPPGHHHYHHFEDVPLVTFPHHMFPSYVTPVSTSPKRSKERFMRV